MNRIDDLSSGQQQQQQKSDISVAMAGTFISCSFMKFFNKINLKNTIRYIKLITNVQGNLKSTNSVLFYTGFCKTVGPLTNNYIFTIQL